MDVVRRAWRGFRGWPLWAQIAAAVGLVLIFAAASAGGDEEDRRTGERGDATSTTEAPESSAETSETTEAAVDDRCVAFPEATAEELISNSDTGQRKIDGPIASTAAVLSDEQTDTGRSLWFISITSMVSS